MPALVAALRNNSPDVRLKILEVMIVLIQLLRNNI